MALVTWLLRKHFPDWEETPLGILQLLVDLRCFVLSYFLFLSWKRKEQKAIIGMKSCGKQMVALSSLQKERAKY